MSTPNTSSTAQEQASRTGPLAGVRILDMATVIAAPFSATLCADLGAQVIKLELPDGSDSLRSLAEGELCKPSDKFVGGKNARNMGTWRGMCPNHGQKKHYEYTMRGTDLDPKALPPGLTSQELDVKLEGHTLSRAILVGRFDVDAQIPE